MLLFRCASSLRSSVLTCKHDAARVIAAHPSPPPEAVGAAAFADAVHNTSVCHQRSKKRGGSAVPVTRSNLLKSILF